MPADATKIPPTLWTTVCPNCGYSLEGLGEAGTCPECGAPYDRSVIVLHGDARGKHESIANAKLSRLPVVAGFLIFYMAIQGLNLANGVRAGSGWTIACIAYICAFIVFQVIRRQNTAHPGLIQVRLGPWGCVQYDDLSGPSLVREITRGYGWIVPVAILTIYVVAVCRGWKESLEYLLIALVALIWAPFAWRESQRFRNAMRQMRSGAIADLNAALCEPASWANITSFRLDEIAKGRHRLTINADFGTFTTRTSPPVDAEVNCTSEQAAQLRELLREWIRGGKA